MKMIDKKIKYRTHFSFPKNNFIIGLGSVLNIAGSYFESKKPKSPKVEDFNALSSDWEIIGKDFKMSKKEFEKENKDELCLNF